ncbi:MAG: ATP phosphoribosyltransferase [Deltaproteobacteria bacterium]|jgi:ATP phosphoribosyltransferase|nr:ATP phosphoribosyltransferase [Deltaproteobacteria bacterium]
MKSLKTEKAPAEKAKVAKSSKIAPKADKNSRQNVKPGAKAGPKAAGVPKSPPKPGVKATKAAAKTSVPASGVLKLGLPKGSLEQYTLGLFARSGWRVNIGSRNYFPRIDDPEIECTLSRSQEMSRYVEQGVIDCGLAGKDWRLENQSDVVVVEDLVYSKSTPTSARWVLAVAGDGPDKASDLRGKKVATELPGVTSRWFAERGIDVQVEFSWGATEAKVVSGLAEAIVEVTETGSTIKAHGLKIIDEILVTHTEFIANRKALADPFKKAKISQLALLLKGALDAEGVVGLKMNVREKDVEKIVGILPCLNAPTVAHLYKTNWLSVEAVISAKVVREIIPLLRDNGAEGIIEYPLNKVI